MQPGAGPLDRGAHHGGWRLARWMQIFKDALIGQSFQVEKSACTIPESDAKLRILMTRRHGTAR